MTNDINQDAVKKCFTTENMKDIVYISNPQISPDGKYAAIVQYKANTEDGMFYSKILICEVKTGHVVKVLEKGNCKAPRFEAKGAFISYLSDISGEYQIYTLNKDGVENKTTGLRHGVKSYNTSNDGKKFVFDADLWEEEVDGSQAFIEMTKNEKESWKEEQEWAPKEITQIDYKRDELKGVRDGSISYIGVAYCDGIQKLLTKDISYQLPVFSPDGSKIACYGMPHTGAHYSSQELFIMNSDGSNMACLTKDAQLCGDVPVCFTEDGKDIVYPAYYTDDKENMISYLYKISAQGGTPPVCIFDPDAEEVSSGVYGMPLSRTQYGDEKSYFSVVGDQVYFLCAWNGAERLYKIAIKEKSVPQLILDGYFSIHEFCAPIEGSILLTRGDYYNLRELYIYNINSKQFTKLMDNNPWLKDYSLGEITTVDVPSKDGRAKIHGVICRPTHFVEGKKYPAVLYVHGGPTVCFTNDFWHEIHALSNAGYVVVYCDPRGSFGYGLKFSNSSDSWGMPAYEDLMGFLDYTISLGFIDEKRVGITGGSYGGYMTCKIVMMTNRFAAAVGQRVFVNQATSYGTGDMGFYSAGRKWSEINIKDCLIKRARGSIIRNIDKLNTPMLLLHGYSDYRCSFEQSEQMFISIKERRKDVPVKLVMFPGENHGVSRTGLLHFQQRHVQEMIDWFNVYLKGADNE